MNLRAILAVPSLLVLASCGLDVEDIGGNQPDDVGLPSPEPPPETPAPETAAARSRWEWLNPTPSGDRLNAIGARAPDDVWLVGEAGAVLRWDGARWKEIDTGLDDVAFYAIWASGPNDVWLVGDAGEALDGVSREPTVVHYDGRSFERDLQIGTRSAHAIWGARPDDVFALLDAGDIGRWNGSTWTITASPTGTVLRDVWGTSSTDVWVAGDRGTLAHFDGSAWKQIASEGGDGPDNPVRASYTYRGLWGAASNDVWALARTEEGGDATLAFVHWDGTRWTVQQKAAQVAGRPLGSLPARHGRQIWGDGPWNIVAVDDGGITPSMQDDAARAGVWSVAGPYWSQPSESARWTKAPATPSFAAQRDTRAVGGLGGPLGLLAAGGGGSLRRFDPQRAPNDSARWREIGATYVDHLRQTVVTKSGSPWARIGPWDPDEQQTLAQWSASGWTRVAPSIRWADGSLAGFPKRIATDCIAAGGDDVWITGHNWDSNEVRGGVPVLARYHEGRWEELPTLRDAHACERLWAAPEGDVWLATKSGGGVRHLGRWSAGAWEELSLPDGIEGLTSPSIAGTGSSDVWLLGYAQDATFVVLHYDGVSLNVALREKFSFVGGTFLAASSPKDVWIRVGPRYLHWDGKAWAPWSLPTTRHEVIALAVFGSSDAYVLAVEDGTRHGIFHWDGTKLEKMRAVSPYVFSALAASPAGDAVWATGDAGSTLRLVRSPKAIH